MPTVKRIALAILNLINLSLVPLIGALQFMQAVPPGEDGKLQIRWEIWNEIVARRFVLTIAGLSAVVIAKWVKEYLNASHHVSREIRQKVMEAMVEECFGNDRLNVRITIFKDAGWVRNRWIFVKRLFTTRDGWKTITHTYVYGWDRLGKPKCKMVFRYSERDESVCEGVAGVARYQESNVEIPDLPDITMIELSTLDIKSKTHAARKVRDYMKESYIRDFETLKRLNRKSRHIYGNVLTNAQGQYRGVLVIDSRADVYPFGDFALQNIPYYLKILASTV